MHRHSEGLRANHGLDRSGNLRLDAVDVNNSRKRLDCQLQYGTVNTIRKRLNCQHCKRLDCQLPQATDCQHGEL